MKRITLLFSILSFISLSVLAHADPRITGWTKGDMSVTVTVEGERDDVIDGLVYAINSAGGAVADSGQLGSTTIIKTDWFEMPHDAWAYDCRLTFNIGKSPNEGADFRVVAVGDLRTQVGGRHVNDNEIRPFLRYLFKDMATGGYVKP